MAVRWLAGNLVGLAGYAQSPEPSSPSSARGKRKATDDGRRSSKLYRSAPYEAGPSNWRDLVTEGVDGIDYITDDNPTGLRATAAQGVKKAQGFLGGKYPQTTYVQEPARRLGTSYPFSDEQFTTEDLYADEPVQYSPDTLRAPSPRPTQAPPAASTQEFSRATPKSPAPVNPNLAPWKGNPTADEKWTTRPNKQAHEFVASHGINAKRLIQSSVNEPEYALRDAEIRDSMWHLMNLIESYVKDHVSTEPLPDFATGDIDLDWLRDIPKETAKIIGCVASGGPGGVQGWKDLFIDEQKRRALMCAIIGNVLVEQVFQHIFFGGSAEDIKTLTDLQKAHSNEDGFDRNRHYALAVRALTDTNSTSLTEPTNFTNHVNHIVSVLWTHLFITHRIYSPDNEATHLSALHNIVTQAGLLSLIMRADPHTVYYFEPVFKEDTFTAKRMECFNFQQMQQRNMRTPDTEARLSTREKARRALIPKAELERSRNDEPLTQITIMHGITAYRLGGWEDARSTLDNVVYEKAEYENLGIRSRILTHAWVYCRWGRARRFKDGKPDDVAAVHGAAWKGGFKEFTDVEGVVDWLAEERKEKMEGKGKGKESAETKKVARGPYAARRQGEYMISGANDGRRRRDSMVVGEGDLQARLLAVE